VTVIGGDLGRNGLDHEPPNGKDKTVVVDDHASPIALPSQILGGASVRSYPRLDVNHARKQLFERRRLGLSRNSGCNDQGDACQQLAGTRYRRQTQSIAHVCLFQDGCSHA